MHPAFFHDPPRADVLFDGDSHESLKAGGFKAVCQPAQRAFVPDTHSPKFRLEAVADLDLAGVFERLKSAKADRFTRFFPEHCTATETELFVTGYIKIKTVCDRFGVLKLLAAEIFRDLWASTHLDQPRQVVAG